MVDRFLEVRIGKRVFLFGYVWAWVWEWNDVLMLYFWGEVYAAAFVFFATAAVAWGVTREFGLVVADDYVLFGDGGSDLFVGGFEFADVLFV